MDLIYVMKHLNTDKKCIKYLEKKRWRGVPTCPYCGSNKSNPKSLRHTCLTCNNSYSVTVGTIFQDSNLPLQKWFMAIVLILSAKKGISSLQLSRDLSINKNTAWLLQMKIRKSMNESEGGLLEGIIEADETFIGGRINNHYPTGRKTSNPSHLQPVLGMVERKGKVMARVIQAPLREIIMPLVKEYITSSSTLVTDGSQAYFPAKNHFNAHKVMSKSSKIFKRGIYHTNTIEGFWSILKRAIIGQYHKINLHYLQVYIDEICFKYNHRNSPDKGFAVVLNNLFNANLATC